METGKIFNSKVLVTGGAGFIGSNIVEVLLQQNNQVICLDNFITGSKKNIETFHLNSNFKLIEGDIRDLETCRNAVKNIDYVLHQAALGSVPRSINDPKTTNDINVSGFLNMLIASKDEKVKRFVFASSSSVYGDSPDLPKVEEKIGKPLSPYAISKLTNEIYAKNFSEIYGLETIGLRYFNVFGKRQSPDGAYAAVIPRFVQQLINGEQPLINGDGSTSRDFTYIDNVVLINQLASTTINREAINTVYNVAFGKQTNLIELVDFLKIFLSKFDTKIATIKSVFGPERAADVKHSLASIAKASKLLNYHPEYDIKEGLKEAIDWYWNELK